MKKLLPILAILVFCFSARAQKVTATVTITNTPTTGATITVGGSTFIWTNGTPIGSYMVLITNTPGNDATNLLNTAIGVLPSFSITSTQVSSNVVAFKGISLTASVSASWATLVLTTNGSGGAATVFAPIGNSTMTAQAQTNVISALVTDIGNLSTNPIPQTSPAASQLVGLANVQTFGNKTITNSSFNGGTMSNSIITNATAISGTVASLTNGGWTGANLTNGQNFGNPFRSPGVGVGSEQFGLGAQALDNFCSAFGDGAIASTNAASAFGDGAEASGVASLALGGGATASGLASIAIGTISVSSSNKSTALGWQAIANNNFSTAIGQSASTTADHQIMMGTSSEYVHFPGGVLFIGTETNISTAGTNTFGGALVIPESSNSSLVNSNNVLTVSANSYLQLSGPSGSFYIAAINGGIDGRVITLENITAQIMVIGNQSGYDTSTSTNRIITMTGADRVIPNNICTLRYDGTSQRWKITSVN